MLNRHNYYTTKKKNPDEGSENLECNFHFLILVI